jgi:hypothetical protein
MEAAFAALSAIGTSAATAVTTAGSALASGASALASGVSSLLPGATTGAAAASGSTALSVLQGTMTAASMLTSGLGGVVSYGEAQEQARAAELEARDKAVRIREEELQKIGASRVAFAASGVQLGSGATVEAAITRDADYERAMAIRSGRINARQLKLRGTGALLSAAGDVAKTGANYAIDLRNRG